MTLDHPIVVQKFGGSSVATSEKITQVAKLIASRAASGQRLCIVVSAMGKTTDQLLALAHEVSKNPSRRELDMLLSCGERASMALLAMALEDLGCKAVSLTGSQSGIITSDVHSGAKILEVRPERVLAELAKGKVVIIAGFQGVSIKREITTLGRGGSDTTAVAMAAALDAEACEIYSDVPGVLTADPKWVENAEHLPQIGIAEMEELALFGAKVMHAQALQLARAEGVTIHAKKAGNEEAPSTLISLESVDEKLSRVLVTSKDPVFHLSVANQGDLKNLLQALLEREIFHVQVNGFANAQGGRWHCLIHPEDAHGFDEWVRGLVYVVREPDCATVSLVGVGLCETPKVSAQALGLLLENAFEIFGMSTAPNRSTFILKHGEAARAVKLLHDRFIPCSSLRA
jgi:aspartate kinase